jgi:hypothetical protein
MFASKYEHTIAEKNRHMIEAMHCVALHCASSLLINNESILYERIIVQNIMPTELSFFHRGRGGANIYM